MRHNKKQEKSPKTMGIICLVNGSHWENFSYLYYSEFNSAFYLRMTTVFIGYRLSNTSTIDARTASSRANATKKLIENNRKWEKTAGHDFAFPRRGGRGSVRSGESRKY
jgi:hypothetical protein